MICEHFPIDVLRNLVVDDTELQKRVEEALKMLGGPEKAKHQAQIQAQQGAMKQRALAEQAAEEVALEVAKAERAVKAAAPPPRMPGSDLH